MTRRTRVAICDDSPTYVAALARVLEAGGDIQVVGRYARAEDLLAVLDELEVDLVTMDLELPGIDGLAAIRQIVATRQLPVLVLSAHTGEGSVRAVEALAAGAIDVLHKAQVPLGDAAGPGGEALRRRVRRLARVHVPAPTAATRAPAAPPEAALRTVRAAAVVASTGGPRALVAALGGLPAEPALPVLVVQHMTAGFTTALATWLDDAIAAPVRLAVNGAVAEPGVWLAPDDAHLTLTGGPHLRLGLDPRTPGDPHRPSGDTLIRSLARQLGEEGAAFVLTGMGRDGARGLRELVAAGGLGVAQDPATATVPGMPRAAAEAGAQLVLDLDGIGALLAALADPDRERVA